MSVSRRFRRDMSMTNDNSRVQLLGRRAFLQNGTLLLAAAATLDASLLFADDDKCGMVGFNAQVQSGHESDAG